MMTKPGERATLTIPDHSKKDVNRALLKRLLDAAGLTEDAYLAAFHSR